MYILFIVIPAALLVLTLLILFLVKRSKQPDAEASVIQSNQALGGTPAIELILGGEKELTAGVDSLKGSEPNKALGGAPAIELTRGREEELEEELKAGVVSSEGSKSILPEHPPENQFSGCGNAGEQGAPSPSPSDERIAVSDLPTARLTYTCESFLHAAEDASVIKYQAISFYFVYRRLRQNRIQQDSLNYVQKCQLEVIKRLAGRTDKFIPKGNNEFTCEHVYDQEKNECWVTIICGQDKISIFKFNETDAGFRHDLKTQQQKAIDAKYDKINESLNRNDELTTILTSIISSGKQDLSYVVDGRFKLTKDHKCEKVFCDLAEHTNNHMNKHSDEVVKLTQDHLDAINIMRATVASILEDNCLVSGNSHTVSKTR